MPNSSESSLPASNDWSWLLAPILGAVYPVISLYLDNLKEAKPGEAILCAVFMAVVAVVVALVFRWWYASSVRASIATVVFMIWLFSYAYFMRYAGRTIVPAVQIPGILYIALAFWLVVIGVPLLLLGSKRWNENLLVRLQNFILLACLFAIGFTAINGARAYFANSAQANEEFAWPAGSKDLPQNWQPKAPNPPRDIYYLVFDRYANASALKEFFDYDNSEFYAELEKRGFNVEREAFTNYPMTVLAMASTLNMRYLGPTFQDKSDYFHVLQHHEVGRRLIEAGYDYHHFGCFYGPLRSSPIAHWSRRVSWLRSEFSESLVKMTPLRSILSRAINRQSHLDQFTGVRELAKNPKPTFAYAHFLVPHPPYVFAADGSALTEMKRATSTDQQLYIEQLKATNRLILETVDAILKSSDTPPIIILQADEGPYLMRGDDKKPREQQIVKRTGVLNAVLIPDAEIAQRLPNARTPVNIFRFLFREYFGAPIEDLPDHVYYWEQVNSLGLPRDDTQFLDVTSELPVEFPLPAAAADGK